MKHFIQPESNQIFGFESDGSQDPFIGPDLRLISDVALAALRAAAQPTNAQLKQAAIDKVRAERKGIMGMLDGMQASALARADVPRAGVIETAKQALRDLTKIDTSACVTAADFKTLFVSRYKVIAGALPADVRLAFAEALL